MNCNDFDAKIDLYIDGMLPHSDRELAEHHVRACFSCDETVTRYQQARALLSTAVTDRVAAVDVSGLWQRIEATLDADVDIIEEREEDRRAGLALRFGAWLRSLRDRAGLPGPSGSSGWNAPITPLRAGAWAAAAAAVALIVSMVTTDTRSVQIASGDGSQSRSVRIDSMEVAAGHTVSTWVRPRTKTRVIWVGDDRGFGVSPASHGR